MGEHDEQARGRRDGDDERSGVEQALTQMRELEAFDMFGSTANRLSRGHTAMILFSCGLAAMWSFSLRGQEIILGDLTMAGSTRPITAQLDVAADGRVLYEFEIVRAYGLVA